MANLHQVTILLVEDDPGHARLIQKNLQRSNISNNIIHVSNGQQAMDYLLSKGEFAHDDAASPILILLDLNMPVLDGYQVLERIKANEYTKRIPVIVLTTTDDHSEITRCYDLGCNAYLTKPVDYEQFSDVIHKVGLFLSIVTVPHEE
ncbi:MAG: response regulator [Chloroflexi bacterium]|nr:response regulator [Chloroflexota bacterium]